MKPDFILISGRSIAVERIDFVDFRQDGIAAIHIGSNSVTTEDQVEVDALKQLLASAEPRRSEEFDPAVE